VDFYLLESDSSDRLMISPCFREGYTQTEHVVASTWVVAKSLLGFVLTARQFEMLEASL